MSKGFTDSANYTAIADAIRRKSGRADEKYTPAEMARAIMMLEPITGAYGSISFEFDEEQLAVTAKYNYTASTGDYFTYADGVLELSDDITITIDGVSLGASRGLTWESWCLSSYNNYTELVPGYRVYCDPSTNLIVVGPVDTTEGAVTLKRNDQHGYEQYAWTRVASYNTLDFVTNYIPPNPEQTA